MACSGGAAGFGDLSAAEVELLELRQHSSRQRLWRAGGAGGVLPGRGPANAADASKEPGGGGGGATRAAKPSSPSELRPRSRVASAGSRRKAGARATSPASPMAALLR
eukprot:scaffold25924_cov66-Phaeocystis_antarctica.AAC.2